MRAPTPLRHTTGRTTTGAGITRHAHYLDPFGGSAPTNLSMYWLCAQSATPVEAANPEVRYRPFRAPEWGDDQSDAGFTTASEGGDAAREGEYQRTHPTDDMEP